MGARIDLMSRLKKPGSAQSVPVPTPGIGTGLPLPPFPQPAPKREPAPKPQVQPATIDVGGSDQLREARIAATKRTAVFGALASVVALAAGIAVGRAQERGERGRLAVTAAGDIEKEVKAANEKIKELDDKLQDANDRLAKKEFPADLAAALGALTVPFEPQSAERPGTGNMGKTLRSLMRYSSAVQSLNEGRDRLRNTLTALQPRIENAWKEENDPMVGFSVIFRPERDKDMMAQLVQNRDPFKLKAEPPPEYTVLVPEVQQGRSRSVEKKVKRWVKGGIDGDPVAVPVTPQTTTFAADKALPQLVLEISEIVAAIRGKNKGTPWETNGLLKDGGDLAEELHRLSVAR